MRESEGQRDADLLERKRDAGAHGVSPGLSLSTWTVTYYVAIFGKAALITAAGWCGYRLYKLARRP
jgi:hypothetical protein